MENFISYNPTKLHFGKNVTDNLGKTIAKFGKRVLLIYGGGSIKNNGIYDRVIQQLKSINAEIFEYSGIKSNPLFEDVDAAAKLGRKNKIDVILAVGGGSVIDSSKMTSITIPVENVSSWDLIKGKVLPQTSIPLISVLTVAATGTEMNTIAVLQNNTTKEKLGYRNSFIFNRHSFLDPQFTYSVSREQTAYGIVDLIAHALEAYFGAGEATLSDRFIFAIIKEAVEYGPKLLDDLHNYELRAKIMYAATTALNGFTMIGKKSGDWGAHALGHELSLLYDIQHGASLSIVYPAWMKHFSNTLSDKIILLGKNVFDTNNIDDTISAFKAFFKLLGSPVYCQDAGISIDKKTEIVENMINNKDTGVNIIMTEIDYPKIVDLFF